MKCILYVMASFLMHQENVLEFQLQILNESNLVI